jgi:arsenite methyltransferase
MAAAPGSVRRRGSYGVDAPYVPVLFAAGGLLLAVPAVVSLARSLSTGSGVQLCCGLFLLLCGASYFYTTRRGKFVVWSRLVRDLRLRGDERVLDLGCGRGAVLLLAAAQVPRGRAIGIDLWKSSDQSGNAVDATRRNAELEGVTSQVELLTGDMTALPLPAGDVDVVVSSLAIHNIKARDGRAHAIDEAVRVLRPGGRLVIADIRAADEYAARLTELGLLEVTRRRLGWRFWYGGPWVAASLVTATKPL